MKWLHGTPSFLRFALSVGNLKRESRIRAFPMGHSKRWILAAILLVAPVAFGQSQGQQTTAPDHMEHRFDNPEQSAKSFDDPARDAWQMPDRVIAALTLKRGQVVADIGAGTGYFTVRLAKAPTTPKVYGVDIEPKMVSYLRDRATKEGLHNVVAVQAAADTPNLPEPVDVVLIVDTYHHIGAARGVFPEAGKVAQAGRQGGHHRLPAGLRSRARRAEFHFPPEKIKAEMSAAGYKLAAQHDFLPQQQFLIFELAGRPSR